MIQFIVEGRELTNISQEAKEWFFTTVRNGKAGQFTCRTMSRQTKAIILTTKLTEQIELFKEE